MTDRGKWLIEEGSRELERGNKEAEAGTGHGGTTTPTSSRGDRTAEDGTVGGCEDLWKSRTTQVTQQKEIDRRMGELRKKTFLAQANLKKIVEKFREQTSATI
jgi:hypothetical protein